MPTPAPVSARRPARRSRSSPSPEPLPGTRPLAGAEAPLGATAGNFLRALLFAAGLGLLGLFRAHVTGRGILLAILSGALASGVGYAIWYVALRGLSTTRAAGVQLAVPLLTAALAVLLLGEPVTLRLALAALAIVGGLGLALATRGGSDRMSRPQP